MTLGRRGSLSRRGRGGIQDGYGFPGQGLHHHVHARGQSRACARPISIERSAYFHVVMGDSGECVRPRPARSDVFGRRADVRTTSGPVARSPVGAGGPSWGGVVACRGGTIAGHLAWVKALRAPLGYWVRLGALYLSQGLPGGFLAVSLPILLAERGEAYGTIGSLGALLSAPWFLKILWAPWADRTALRRWPSVLGGRRFRAPWRRRPWILGGQAGMIGCCLALAAGVETMAVAGIAALFFVLNLCAASQDIGVDGYAMDSLAHRALGPGNAAQVAGFKLGNILGGGVLVAWAGATGWSLAFVIMALVLIGVAASVPSLVESDADAPSVPETAEAPSLVAVLRRSGPSYWVLLFAAKFAESLGGLLLKPVLRNLGYKRAEIGLMDGVFGSAATLLGAALLGTVLYRQARRGVPGIGRCLALVVPLQGLVIIGYAFLHAGTVPLALLLVTTEHLFGGAVGAGVFAWSMAVGRRWKRGHAAHFTASQTIYMAGGAAAGALGGFAADWSGPASVFLASGALTLFVGVGFQRQRAEAG